MCLGLATLHATGQHLTESPATTTLRMIQMRDDGVLLELTAPLPVLNVVHYAEQAVTSLTLPGTQIDARPGSPRLPVIGALLAIPPGRTVELRIVDDMQTTAALAAPLLANRTEGLTDTTIAAVDTGAPPFAFSASASSGVEALTSAAVAPSPPLAAIAGIETWRSQTVARLLFHPVELTADGGRLIVHRRLLVALDFIGNKEPTSAGHAATFDEGMFEPVLQSALLNYAQGRMWRQRPAALSLRAVAQDERRWRVHVPASGMVRIDCAMLADAGAPVEVTPPRHWQVRRNGKDGPTVATGFLNDNDDARCDAGESLIFYADVQSTRYAADAIFWLHATAEPGVAIEETTPPLATHDMVSYLHRDRYERNRLYYSYVPLTEDAEHWYWDILTPAISVTRTYPFTVSELAAGDAAQVNVVLAGYDGAHLTQVAVNEHNVATSAWDGRRTHTITATVPLTWLQAGVNSLRISASGPTPDLQYVDAFTVTYPRQLTAQADQLVLTAPSDHRLTLDSFSTPDVAVFSLADPDRPRRVAATVTTPCPCRVTFDTPADGAATYLALTAAAYLTPTAIAVAPVSDLRNPVDGADYLILTPAELTPALAPLISQRRAAGLRVRVVDVQAIYDDFGDGRPDPAAIQRFLNHTLTAWPAPAPAYVLLVGDGSYDPRGYQTAPLSPTVPAYLRAVDPVIGETASDNRYVTATADSQLPQMMIGRLPARTAAEATAMINKILAFEAAGADAAWRQRAVIVADNAFHSDGHPDPAGNFWALADRAAALLTAAGQSVERLYYNPCAAATAAACDLPDPPYPRFADAGALTTAFQTCTRAGRGLVIYTGHASPLSWAGAPYLLRTSDALALGNETTPFVALEMSCYTGFFHGPYDTLAETLLRTVNGGAVATWSSSGQNPLRGQDILLEHFLTTALADPTASMTLGQAMLAAKVHLYGAGGGAYASALDTFHLLGDPALFWRAVAPPVTATALPTALPTAPPTHPASPTATRAAAPTPTATVTPTDTAIPAATSTPTTASATPVAPPTPAPSATPSPTDAPWQSATQTPTAPGAQLFLPLMQAARAEGE